MTESSFYVKRRATLAEKIPHGIVIAGHTQMQAKADMAFPFVQDASFLYLTGINEPDWVLFWDLNEWLLVKPAVSETYALFEGQLDDSEAQRVSGISAILSVEEYESRLQTLSSTSKTIATIGEDPHQGYYDFAQNPATKKVRTKLAEIFEDVIDCRKDINKARAIKSKDELTLQRRAIDITLDTFKAVKNTLPQLTHEYEIEALLSSGFRTKGSNGHAYSPIVASEGNACTLHYGKNQDVLPKNGLVLIDAGTQVGGYTADITRTYAVGEPTERQVAVHAAVEKAHHKIIGLIKPGLAIKDYQQEVDEIMKDALQEVGLLENRDDTETYRKYFPHAISHGLGIDVHESLGGFDTFKEGMVFTVEPGIYIPEESIGVRIEDNILVTSNGHENLSKALATSL